MPYESSLNAASIREWLYANLTPHAIETDLKQKGFDQDYIQEHLKEFRKQRNAKKQVKGFVMMILGGFLGFLSCVLTLTQAFPELYGVILYGLTIIGVTIAFVGVYFVLE